MIICETCKYGNPTVHPVTHVVINECGDTAHHNRCGDYRPKTKPEKGKFKSMLEEAMNESRTN